MSEDSHEYELDIDAPAKLAGQPEDPITDPTAQIVGLRMALTLGALERIGGLVEGWTFGADAEHTLLAIRKVLGQLENKVLSGG